MRLAANRKKPDEKWFRTKALLDSTTLFLVHRCPLVYTLKDESGNIYRLTIGNPHSCTCRVEICIHFLYIMLKVLRISEESSLCWQTSFTDAEIETALGSNRSNNRPTRVRSVTSKKGIINNSSHLADSNCVSRQPIDDQDENICPICQDDMKNENALTWCRKSCGNNMHAKCMKTFAQFKVSNNLPISCPLCREDWGPDAMQVIVADCLGKQSTKHCCATIRCFSCTLPVRGSFYRCLQCSQQIAKDNPNYSLPTSKNCNDARAPAKSNLFMDFCQRCFQSIGREHNSHGFLSSDAATVSTSEVCWYPAKNPRSVRPAVDPDVLRDLQTRELTSADYDMLLGLGQEKLATLPQLLVGALPVSAVTDAHRTGPCGFCGAVDPQTDNCTRTLLCGHVVHEKCLLSKIEDIEDSAAAVRIRCGRNGCGRTVFPCVSRRKLRKQVSPDDKEAGVDANADESVAPSASIPRPLGIAGLSVGHALQSSRQAGAHSVSAAITPLLHRGPGRVRRNVTTHVERITDVAQLRSFVLTASTLQPDLSLRGSVRAPAESLPEPVVSVPSTANRTLERLHMTPQGLPPPIPRRVPGVDPVAAENDLSAVTLSGRSLSCSRSAQAQRESDAMTSTVRYVAASEGSHGRSMGTLVSSISDTRLDAGLQGARRVGRRVTVRREKQPLAAADDSRPLPGALDICLSVNHY